VVLRVEVEVLDFDVEVLVDEVDLDVLVDVLDVDVLVVDTITGLNTAASSVYLSYVPAVQLTGNVLDPATVAK